METVDLKDLVQFAEEPVRSTVFETDRLWTQAVCLDRNQSFGPVADPQADAVLTVIAGEAVILVERKRRRLKQWGAALVPAGSDVTLTNASNDPLVVLIVTAPPPA